MPNLNEGTLFYMPTTLPGISVTKAAELLQTQDRIIKTFPEVASVFGKAGRAATATDPAPTEMFETVINLKPKSEWRPGVTVDRLIAEMDKALQFPGVSNAWTMPIKARIDMLSTGIRTPVGVKVFGTDLTEMEQLAREIETGPQDRARHVQRLRRAGHRRLLPRHRARPRRAARYGLMVGDVQDVVATALGGETVTTTVEGRERYGVNIRYPRDLRSDPQAIARDVLVPLPGGGTVPLGEVAEVEADARRDHRSAPRTASSRPTSSSISATGTSAAMSPRRSRPSPPMSSSRPATTSSGAASSNISSAPRRG